MNNKYCKREEKIIGMEKDCGKKIILNFLNVSLLFQLLHLLTICFVSFFRYYIVDFFTYNTNDIEFNFNYMYFIGGIFIAIIYSSIYLFLRNKIKSDKKISLFMNYFIGIFDLLLYCGIPNIFGSIFQRIGVLSNLDIDNGYPISYIMTLRSIYNTLTIFLFISVVLLICALVMYWFRMRYCFVNSEENNVQ